MDLVDLLMYDAVVALVEFRAGWLSSPTAGQGYTGEQGDSDTRTIHFADGTRLREQTDTGIYSVLSPTGQLWAVERRGENNQYSILRPDGRLLMDG